MYSKPLIHNYGATKTFVQANGQKHMNKIDWKLDYDGSNVHGDVAVKNDGQRKHYKINMDNNDLSQLLGSQKNSYPIHRRLENDLFSTLEMDRPHEFIIPANTYDNAFNPMIKPFSDVQHDMRHVSPQLFIIHAKNGPNRHFPKDSIPLNYHRLKHRTHRIKPRRLRRRSSSRKSSPINKTYRVKMGRSKRSSNRNSKRTPLVKLTDIND